LNLNKMDFVA